MRGHARAWEQPSGVRQRSSGKRKPGQVAQGSRSSQVLQYEGHQGYHSSCLKGHHGAILDVIDIMDITVIKAIMNTADIMIIKLSWTSWISQLYLAIEDITVSRPVMDITNSKAIMNAREIRFIKTIMNLTDVTFIKANMAITHINGTRYSTY
jgi:hypothetical protein